MRRSALRLLLTSLVVGRIVQTLCFGSTNLFEETSLIYPCVDRPDAVAIGDLNSDGLNDVVVTDDEEALVYFQTATNGLNAPISLMRYDWNANTRWISIGDVTDDGMDDVIISHDSSADGRAEVFVQTATGMPTTATYFLQCKSPRRSCVGDFNGDSLNDIALVRAESYGLALFYQMPTGGFTEPRYLYSCEDANWVVVSQDVDSDALADLIVLEQQGYTNGIYVHRQKNGVPSSLAVTKGTFLTPEMTWHTNGPVEGIAVDDVTGDERPDMVVTFGGNRPNSWIRLYTQTPTNTFVQAGTYPAYDSPTPVQIHDLDGNGLKDVLVGHRGFGAISVYRQILPGVLADYDLYPMQWATFPNVNAMDVGDLNNDGQLDVVGFNNWGMGEMNVLLHKAKGDVAPDALLRVFPSRVRVEAASQTNILKVVVLPRNGFSQGTVLTNEVPPAGMLAWWDDTTVRDGEHNNRQFTLAVGPEAKPGSYDISVTMLCATYSATAVVSVVVMEDRDSDQLHDEWEIRYFGDISRWDGSGNPDQDTADNKLEHDVGTSPVDGLSQPFSLTVSGVPAEAGQPVPFDYGTNWVASGTLVTCRVDAAESEILGVRKRCIGWERAGGVPLSGTESIMSFTVSTNIVITWKWTNETALVQVHESVAETGIVKQVLEPVGGADEFFGTAVSLHESTVFIGHPGETVDAKSFAGAAYVFTNGPTGWVESAHLTDHPPVSFGNLGSIVSLWGDWAIVGAGGRSSVNAYHNGPTGWQYKTNIKPHNYCGTPVSVDLHADRLVLGYPSDLDSDNLTGDAGSAVIFRLRESDWCEEAKLMPADRDWYSFHSDKFGAAVAIQNHRVVVGASEDDDLGDRTGSAYVFRLEPSNVVQEAKLTASDGVASGLFGAAVDITDDLIIVGSPGRNTVYAFRRIGTNWTEEAQLTAPYGSEFGSDVSMFGRTLIVGEDGRRAFHRFTRDHTRWIYHGRTWSGGSVVSCSRNAFAVTEPDHFDAGYASIHAMPETILFEETTNWYELGETASTMTALSARVRSGTNYCFTQWNKDGTRQPGETAKANNPVTDINMASPHVTHARYMREALDTDSDTLPDWWEWLYFGGAGQTPAGDNDSDGLTNAAELAFGTDPRSADTDGDGMTDGNEATAMTDPTAEGSWLHITDISTSGEANSVTWEGGTGVSQVVEWSTNLASGGSDWIPMFTSSIPATCAHVAVTNSTIFYRIMVRP